MTDETMFEMQQIGVRIREERQNQKMSQAKLAELSNVSLPIISSIENGKSVMLLDTFLKIINQPHFAKMGDNRHAVFRNTESRTYQSILGEQP